uniref:Uncharacterized protein n=1 Tax=Glossina pallidipes TaxID=7398 RepID=A0A1B0AIV3_GLOPL
MKRNKGRVATTHRCTTIIDGPVDSQDAITLKDCAKTKLRIMLIDTDAKHESEFQSSYFDDRFRYKQKLAIKYSNCFLNLMMCQFVWLSALSMSPQTQSRWVASGTFIKRKRA